MAYRDEVASLGSATCWLDGGDPQRGMPLAAIIGTPRPGRHLYVCGPKGLIAAVLAIAGELGWSEAAVHSELFTGDVETGGDTAFDVELAPSNITLSVPPGVSILDPMLYARLY